MPYVRRGALLLFCVTLCGCYAGYPSDWAPLRPAQTDCLSISGAYHNRGAWSRSGGGSAYLAPRLFQDINDKALREYVGRVVVAVTNAGTLEITAFNRDEVIRKKQFLASKDEYRCSEGRILIPYLTASTVDNNVLIMAAAKGTLTLARATDEALVVEDSAVAIGVVFLVIPAPFAGSEWTRFLPFPYP